MHRGRFSPLSKNTIPTCPIEVSNARIISRRSDKERLHTSVESAAGDKRKEPPLPPIKGDGSVDYDGESVYHVI